MPLSSLSLDTIDILTTFDQFYASFLYSEKICSQSKTASLALPEEPEAVGVLVDHLAALPEEPEAVGVLVDHLAALPEEPEAVGVLVDHLAALPEVPEAVGVLVDHLAALPEEPEVVGVLVDHLAALPEEPEAVGVLVDHLAALPEEPEAVGVLVDHLAALPEEPEVVGVLVDHLAARAHGPVRVEAVTLGSKAEHTLTGRDAHLRVQHQPLVSMQHHFTENTDRDRHLMKALFAIKFFSNGEFESLDMSIIIEYKTIQGSY